MGDAFKGFGVVYKTDRLFALFHKTWMDGFCSFIFSPYQLVGTVRIGAACSRTPFSVKENNVIKK